MSRSIIWAILDKKCTNALLDNMIIATLAWSADGKKASDCLNLPLAFFDPILFLLVEATKSLLTFSSVMFPELLPCVNGQKSEYPYSVNANDCEDSNTFESGNISNPTKSPLVLFNLQRL